MTAPDDISSTAAPAPVKSTSRWEDFVDIFVSPSDVFERRRNSGFFVPLLVFVVLLSVISYIGKPVMAPIFDAEYARTAANTIKHNPQVTPEQMATGRAFAEKFQMIGIVAYAILMPLILGVIVWIVGKFMSAKEDIGAACMIATYAVFPRILEAIVAIAQAYFMDPASLNGRYRVTLGVGRFLNPDTVSPVLLAIVGRIDVFTIWVTVLLAIGLAVVGRIPKSRAALAGVIIWVVGAIPAVWGAIRAS